MKIIAHFLLLLLASTYSDVSVVVSPDSWIGVKFNNETGSIDYVNVTNTQRQIDGFRAIYPNFKGNKLAGSNIAFGFQVDDGTGLPQFDILIGDGNGGSLNDNLPLNILNPGKGNTFVVTVPDAEVDSGKDWTPYHLQTLIIGGKSLAEKKPNKDIGGITLDELTLLSQTASFYDSTLYILDTLGIHGSEWGAGFIDTWVDQETNEPIWQIQVCEIPVEDTTVSPRDTFWVWNEPKALLLDSLDVNDGQYGGTKRPFYMMGLAMTQEYMNIDMQSLMGKGFQESNAGLSMYETKTVTGYTDTTYDTVLVLSGALFPSGQTTNGWSPSGSNTGGDTTIIYVSSTWVNGYQKLFFKEVKYTNRSVNGATSMGPMHYEESTFHGQIFDAYPKYFPYENGVYQNSAKFVNAPTGGSPLNHPSIVNAYLISSLNMWYSWQLVVATLGEDALEKMKTTSNRRLMGDLVNYAWNQGVNGNYRQAFDDGGINFLYIGNTIK